MTTTVPDRAPVLALLVDRERLVPLKNGLFLAATAAARVNVGGARILAIDSRSASVRPYLSIGFPNHTLGYLKRFCLLHWLLPSLVDQS